MKASEIARSIAELLDGDRERTHGDKREIHRNIASLWTTYLGARRDPSAALTEVDVALMMVLLKIARTQRGIHNPDDYLDSCGYAAIAGELASGASSEAPGGQ